MTPLQARSTALAAATLVGVAATAHVAVAHDFWLVPNAFVVTPGSALEVRGQTSSAFPTSESAVTVDRVAEARLLGAASEVPLRDLGVAGTSLRLRHRPATAGQYVVAVALKPRSVRESAAGFRQYLELEGAPEALQRYEREGRLPTTDSITRRYAKYAKTLVEVGQSGPRAFSRTTGQPVEFVPLTDPSASRSGDTLAVRLLFRGRPLAGARVRAGAATPDAERALTRAAPSARGTTAPGGASGGAAGAAATSASAARAAEARSAEVAVVDAQTDAEGVVRVPLAAAGLWNVRTIQIVPADPGSGADWDVHWATLVFRAAPGQAGRSGQTGSASDGGASAVQSSVAGGMGTMTTGAPAASALAVAGAQAGTSPGDSAEVAGVVAAFDRALEAGDTATVLSLLAPDAVILESGSVESREEYRSHHLAGDIAFARAVRRTQGPVRVVVRGDAAWASSTGGAQGTYRERAVNSTSAELMVLTRESSGWRIRAVHWSSRTRRR